MKYTIPITSDNWILKNTDRIKTFFKFCHCTGEDCASDCPYVAIGLTDYDSDSNKLNRKECTVILFKHYKRLMYLEGKSRKEINEINNEVKRSVKCCKDYYGYNRSGIKI